MAKYYYTELTSSIFGLWHGSIACLLKKRGNDTNGPNIIMRTQRFNSAVKTCLVTARYWSNHDSTWRYLKCHLTLLIQNDSIWFDSMKMNVRRYDNESYPIIRNGQVCTELNQTESRTTWKMNKIRWFCFEEQSYHECCGMLRLRILLMCMCIMQCNDMLW